jgi:hypothetical protein
VLRNKEDGHRSPYFLSQAGKRCISVRNEIKKSDHTEQGQSVKKMNIILRQTVPSTDFTNDLGLSQYIGEIVLIIAYRNAYV